MGWKADWLVPVRGGCGRAKRSSSSSCAEPNPAALLQMSFAEDLPEVDGADLLGLLFQGEDNGSVEPLFPVEDELMDAWLSEQDVRRHASVICAARDAGFIRWS